MDLNSLRMFWMVEVMVILWNKLFSYGRIRCIILGVSPMYPTPVSHTTDVWFCFFVARLILRCRQDARTRFARLRSDVLVKLELLDNKHVQDVVWQLQRLVAGLAEFHGETLSLLQGNSLFPIEVDLARSAFQYKSTSPVVQVCRILALIWPVALEEKKERNLEVSTLCTVYIQKFVTLRLNCSISKFQYFLCFKCI